MAVVGNAEEKYEDAWVNALGKSADIAVPIRKENDQSNSQIYPVVLVYCSGVLDATSGTPDGYDKAIVDLSARTFKDYDKDKSVVQGLIGAIRDIMRNASILSWLEEVGGLSIANIIQDDVSFVDDESEVRIRTLTVETYGTLVNLPPP